MSVQLAAAIMAAASALLAAFMSSRTMLAQRRQVAHTAEVELRRAQLNDLYGPIFMRLWTTLKLRGLLPVMKEDGTPWLLGDHIEEIQSGTDESAKDAFREMLTIGEEIENILVSRSGLFTTFPPPSSFGHLISYSKMLRLAWQRGRNQAEPEKVRFPEEFYHDIARSISEIRTRLAQLGALPKEVTKDNAHEDPFGFFGIDRGKLGR